MCRVRSLFVAAACCAAVLALPTGARAADRFCDPAYENCRTPLLELIRNETVGIDVAFWFMTDGRYVNELVSRWRAGVPVRVIMDTQANSYDGNAATLAALRDAGIPMREKTTGGIVHWKMMLFAGQNVVQFSGANYSSFAFVAVEPYANYVDEVIYFADQPSLVQSFKTKYDDVWVSTTGYSNYANITAPPVRNYPVSPIDPQLNFVPWQNFASRSVGRYNAETQGIDAIIYRITDRRHTDALIAAIGRGVPVRILTEQAQYRDETRLWHSWNVDRLYAAGAQIRHRGHAGLNHEKLTLLAAQGMTVFGSSNWTSPSASSQLEHNLFSTDPAFHAWARAHFDRKWYNTGPSAESEPFVPLPPDTPTLKSPAPGATAQPLAVELAWYAGPWAHKYDVLLGTDPSNLAPVLVDTELGPSQNSRDLVRWTAQGLAPGTTYYWRVVSRTMANVQRESVTWSFTTEGEGGGPPAEPLPSGWTNRDIGSVGAAGSVSYSGGTFTVQGSGADIWNTADEFHFAYRTLAGDGSIVARVAGVTNTDVWAKAGVMIRESLSAGSRHAAMLVSSGKGLAFQRRTSTGGVSTHTGGGSSTAPYWVRLTRSGSTVSAYKSTNGVDWALVGTDTIAMSSTVYVGLAVTSHNDGVLATATVSNVSVDADVPPAPMLPTGWSSQDVGAVAAGGTASESGGTFTVTGSGADIWGTADEFQFAYRALAADATIVARVASVQNVNVWTKAGVMIRQDLTAGSPHASVFVTPGKGLAFQRRTTARGVSLHTSVGTATAPHWVKLVRTGTTFTAFTSADGLAWTAAGSETISMTGTVYVGLAVTSHSDGATARASFEAVDVR